MKYLPLLLIALLALPLPAFACSDCEDEVCLGPPGFRACACVPNVGRCPIPIPPPQRFAFCNITENGKPGENASCKNCSSILSGDAGKADCLARHGGHYVKENECTPQQCRTIASVAPQVLFASGTATVGKSQAAAKSGTPILLKATKMEITKLTSEGKTVKASANVTTTDGEELACSYEMAYEASKTGVKLNPKSESCAVTK